MERRLLLGGQDLITPAMFRVAWLLGIQKPREHICRDRQPEMGSGVGLGGCRRLSLTSTRTQLAKAVRAGASLMSLEWANEAHRFIVPNHLPYTPL